MTSSIDSAVLPTDVVVNGFESTATTTTTTITHKTTPPAEIPPTPVNFIPTTVTTLESTPTVNDNNPGSNSTRSTGDTGSNALNATTVNNNGTTNSGDAPIVSNPRNNAFTFNNLAANEPRSNDAPSDAPPNPESSAIPVSSTLVSVPSDSVPSPSTIVVTNSKSNSGVSSSADQTQPATTSVTATVFIVAACFVAIAIIIGFVVTRRNRRKARDDEEAFKSGGPRTNSTFMQQPPLPSIPIPSDSPLFTFSQEQYQPEEHRVDVIQTVESAIDYSKYQSVYSLNNSINEKNFSMISGGSEWSDAQRQSLCSDVKHQSVYSDVEIEKLPKLTPLRQTFIADDLNEVQDGSMDSSELAKIEVQGRSFESVVISSYGPSNLRFSDATVPRDSWMTDHSLPESLVE